MGVGVGSGRGWRPGPEILLPEAETMGGGDLSAQDPPQLYSWKILGPERVGSHSGWQAAGPRKRGTGEDFWGGLCVSKGDRLPPR